MPAQPGQSFDLFISYARADNQHGWITAFVAELLAEHRRLNPGRELTPFFDQHSITTGADWQHYLAHGVAGSRLFLAFLSPNYLASPWCRREWNAWLDVEISKHILTQGVRPIYIVDVPGLVGPGQLPDAELARALAKLFPPKDESLEEFLAATATFIHQLRRRDFSHSHLPAAFAAGPSSLQQLQTRSVLATLAQDLEHHSQRVLRAAKSPSTVPTLNPKFSGRRDELFRLRKELVDNQTGVISAIHGLGGMGKTDLAFTYAWAHASDYPGGRFLIPCERKPSLRDAALVLGDFFHDQIAPEERFTAAAHFKAIARCLRHRLERHGHVLLLLDNVTDPGWLSAPHSDDLTGFGPTLHLLATTREGPPAGSPPPGTFWLPLGLLPAPDALDLLEKHRPFASEPERQAAQRIVQRLGGYSITIELVAAWLAAHPEVSCAGFLQRLGLEEFETLDALSEDQDAKLRRHNDERRLDAVLRPTLESLQPDERLALEYAALLPPDSIAWEWLEILVGDQCPEVAAATQPGHEDRWAEIRRRLVALSLLSESRPPGEIARMHRTLQAVTLRECAQDPGVIRRHIIEHALRRCASLQKHWAEEDVRWELDPLTAWAYLLVAQDPAAGGLLESKLGRFLYEVARYAEAEPLLEHCLVLAEQRYGHDHSEVGIALSYVALLLEKTGRLIEAEPLMRRALAISEASFGPNDRDVAAASNNLADLLLQTNRPDEAEPLLRKALRIDEESSGTSSLKVAIRLSSLAALLHSCNRLTEAEPLMRRALEIVESNLEPESPEVATLACNLAGLMQGINRPEEAEPLVRRALRINEAAFGSNHPNVAHNLQILAALLQARNRLLDTEPLLRRSLRILEATYGHEHPTVAAALNNLAQLLQNLNQFAEAEPLARRALAIDETALGVKHPNVGIRISNLAGLLEKTNRKAEAEKLRLQALAIFQGGLGSIHPKVSSELGHLANLFLASQRFKDAEAYMRRALTIDDESFGPGHPNVALRLNNLAQILQAMNRHAEAEPFMRRTVEVLLKASRTAGRPHSNLNVALKNLSALFIHMGDTPAQAQAKIAALAHSHGVSLG